MGYEEELEEEAGWGDWALGYDEEEELGEEEEGGWGDWVTG